MYVFAGHEVLISTGGLPRSRIRGLWVYIYICLITVGTAKHLSKVVVPWSWRWEPGMSLWRRRHRNGMEEAQTEPCGDGRDFEIVWIHQLELMYVYVHIYMCIYMRVWVRTLLHLRMHVYIYTCAFPGCLPRALGSRNLPLATAVTDTSILISTSIFQKLQVNF